MLAGGQSRRIAWGASVLLGAATFAGVLTMAVLYVALNLIIDMLYGVIDPRVRVDA